MCVFLYLSCAFHKASDWTKSFRGDCAVHYGEIHGIELMETVPELAAIPVIFISAYGRDGTVARALERGADDDLVKPFSATELTARVQAALRKLVGPEPFALGELAVHHEERRVTVGGRPQGNRTTGRRRSCGG